MALLAQINPDYHWITAAVQCRMYSDSKFIEQHLGVSDDLDEDGYPSEIALEMIKRWHWNNFTGLFEFIEGIWWMPNFGWTKEEPKDDKITYHLATAGWSGNEAIIDALESNKNMFWGTCWVESRRGGGYIFEVRDIV